MDLMMRCETACHIGKTERAASTGTYFAYGTPYHLPSGNTGTALARG
jgi:hypothetical protein